MQERARPVACGVRSCAEARVSSGLWEWSRAGAMPSGAGNEGRSVTYGYCGQNMPCGCFFLADVGAVVPYFMTAVEDTIFSCKKSPKAFGALN